MPINRGYSFGDNEIVTNDSLHSLVDQASLSGLAPDDFSGDIHGLSTATPVSIRDGDLLFLHEPAVSLTRPTGIDGWSHPNYLVHYNGQWVSLLGGDRLETARAVLNFGGAAVLPQGGPAYLFAAGANSITLHANQIVNSVDADKLPIGGAAQATIASGGGAPRITMIGYGIASFAASLSSTQQDPWFDTLYAGGLPEVWNRSTATFASGFHAYRLNSTDDGDSSDHRVQPAFHMGAIVFRE